MPYSIPSSADLVARNLANIEGRLNATTPPADKAYNHVLAVTEGMAQKGEYSYAADRVAAAFALTAMGEDLERIGNEYGVYKDPAVACRVLASLPAVDGTVVPIGRLFVGPQGLQYQAQAQAVAPVGASGSGISLDLLCLEAGIAGNISAGDELATEQPIPGAGRVATVTAVSVTGAEVQDEEEYRVQVLDAERAEGGGGSPGDIRNWGQQVAGVKRVYPFTGPFVGSGLSAYPGMRSVYVEATSAIDVDGIAPAGLLASVKSAILTDPLTSTTRDLLGLTADYLYVKSIIRTPIYVKVVGMSVRSGTLAAAQAAIISALDILLRGFRPFVQGLDPDFDRLDKVAATILSREVQEVLEPFGGTAQNVLFGTTVGSFLGEYPLANNETAKLGGVTWEVGT